jgi:hypothetical protein
VAQVGLQGVVRPKNLQASAAPLVYVAQALGGSDWARVMALSVIATTGAGIVLGIIVAGLILMLASRFLLRSPFFQIQRESDHGSARATSI